MYGLKSLCMSNPEILFSHARLEKLVHVKSGNLLFTCTRQKILACKKQKIQFHMYPSKILCMSKTQNLVSHASLALYITNYYSWLLSDFYTYTAYFNPFDI